jgi:ADP-heptose:LPS heptosyltransferase
MGDIVLTSPVIRTISKTYPDAQIHYATKVQFASLLQHHPSIHTLHLLDKKNKKAFEKALIAVGFDTIIDLHNNLRTRLIAHKIKGAKVLRFDKLNWQKWIAVRTGSTYFLPTKHLVDRYFDSLQAIGVCNDGLGLDFYMDSDPLPTAVAQNIPSQPYLAIAIGGQHFTKRLPLEKWEEILNNCPFPVVVLGAKEDNDLAEQLCKTTKGSPRINLCGKTNILQSAKVLKGAYKLISNDTGLMHIGAAFDMPILSLWGNTIPAFGMYPYYPEGSKAALQSNRLEVEGLSCRPCSKIGHDSCPQGHFECMYKIEWNDKYF